MNDRTLRVSAKDPITGEVFEELLDIDLRELTKPGHPLGAGKRIINEFKDGKKITLNKKNRHQILKMEEALKANEGDVARFWVKDSTEVSQSLLDFAKNRGVVVLDDAGKVLN